MKNKPPLYRWMPQPDESKRDEREQKGRTDASQKGFYATPFWRGRRAGKLYKNPFCEHCEKNGISVEATHVDHIKPLPDPCTWLQFVILSAIELLQSLCAKCHFSKTAHDRHGTKKLSRNEIIQNMQQYED